MLASFYWPVLRRYWYVVGLLGLIGLVTALGATLLQPQTYSSSTMLLVEPVNSGNQYNDILSAERLANTYSELITAPGLAEEVIRTLKLGISPEKLLKLVTVRPVRETQLLKITVEHSDPLQAKQLADQFALSFIEANRKRLEQGYGATEAELNAQLSQVRSELTDLNTSLKEAIARNDPNAVRLQAQMQDKEATFSNLTRAFQALKLNEASARNSLSVAQPAISPDRPSWPVLWLNLLLGGLLGLGLGLALAIGRGLFSTKPGVAV